MVSFPFVQASSERDGLRMALACGVAVALLGFAAETVSGRRGVIVRGGAGGVLQA